jgi:hypothetical protein
VGRSRLAAGFQMADSDRLTVSCLEVEKEVVAEVGSYPSRCNLFEEELHQ